MDNCHMLSIIIEQKMCPDDWNVWSRDLERERKPANAECLDDVDDERDEVTHACLKKVGQDDWQANCSWQKQCNKVENGSQCTFSHNPLLHKSSAVGVTLASVTSQKDSMLPVIAANICGPNGLHKRGNVLLDSGAQISLIQSETADSLGLKGRDISVNIIKVGGEEE
ncbi:PREDICTED: uncharacterized protein LOC107334806 [Paramuricea clavata]|uniref:PREDICTED: uncharacterized protein LOC107334806 n=1 Tax=Paramuricea clavata TaxID=317549 RepID=A0A6S7H122_PARCT|nr:PREDICTED: uncharacterized protein LOC107334806 [Paramuricea clavata]